MADNRRPTRVYDILNAGPRHRFTVSDRLCHNCGFGMGPEKFKDTAHKFGVSLSDKESADAVHAWREANPRIVDLWWVLDRAARTALAGFKRPVTRTINDNLSLTASLSGTGRTLMTIALPSGRRLYYRNARLETLEGETRESILYDGTDQSTKQWTRQRAWGAKLVEQCTQAVARDVIVEAALRVDRLGLGDLVLSVHDELVFEVPADNAHALAPRIKAAVDQRPAWALDLPVASEGGIISRYVK